MARAAWLAGLVAAISTLAFSLVSGENYYIEYGAR